MVDFLLCAESFRCCFVTHLDEITNRKIGKSGTASGNSSSKKRRTSSSVFVVAKLRGPSNSQKSVHVNEPSGFGSAIIMKLFRGHMWSAFFSICHEPSGPGGMVSSL